MSGIDTEHIKMIKEAVNLPAELFDNHSQLLEKVDLQCDAIGQRYPDALACKAGCASCCRSISLFSVEAVRLLKALVRLSTDSPIYPDTGEDPDACPLLAGGLCRVYADRPIICRTHGYPILFTDDDGQSRVDFCPLNFTGFTDIDGDAVLMVDRINEILFTLNRLFLEQAHGFGIHLPDRISTHTVLKAALTF